MLYTNEEGRHVGRETDQAIVEDDLGSIEAGPNGVRLLVAACMQANQLLTYSNTKDCSHVHNHYHSS